MHRIDGPSAAPGGFFSEGDPLLGTPATVVTDDWTNAVQEEICGVIEGAGIALSKPSNAQLLAALHQLLLLAMPVGAVLPGYWTVAPNGFALCTGVLVARASIPRLTAHAVAAGLIVSEATWAASAWTLFGAGDGTTTIRLPDLRGEGLRFVDMGKGVNPGRGLGTWEADETRLHGHPFLTGAGNANTDSVGGIATDQQGAQVVQPAFTGTPSDNNQRYLIGGSGGTETRMRNVALAPAIRC